MKCRYFKLVWQLVFRTNQNPNEIQGGSGCTWVYVYVWVYVSENRSSVSERRSNEAVETLSQLIVYPALYHKKGSRVLAVSPGSALPAQ